MGACVESLPEVEVDHICRSPFIYPASHVIVESYQIGQAWFPLGESRFYAAFKVTLFDDEQLATGELFIGLGPLVSSHASTFKA